MDDRRLRRTKSELRREGLACHVVVGVRGSSVRTDQRLTTFCRRFCTDKTVGCALAHMNALQAFARTGAEWGVIIEDDVKVLKPGLRARILAQAERMTPSTDFLMLYCMGCCSPGSVATASAAAYIVTKQGAAKALAHKIPYHIDAIRNSPCFENVVGEQLFGTYDQRLGVVVGDQSLTFWLEQDAIQLRSFRVSVQTAAVGMAAWTMILFFMQRYMSPHIWLNAVAATAALWPTLVLYQVYEAQYFRCTAFTSCAGVVLPALAIVCAPHTLTGLFMLVMAYGQMMFTVLYTLDTR